MKKVCRIKNAGFTLLELLLVITVVAILMALLLPAIENGRKRVRQTACVSNLKQIYVAIQLFKGDHNGDVPAGVSTNDGGVHEFLFGPRGISVDWSNSLYRVFQALSNSLVSPKLLICRADDRVPANSFAELTASNISYFLTLCFIPPGFLPSGPAEESNVYWAGDRNLNVSRGYEFHWTHEMHQWRGNILFGDGHVEQLRDAELAGNRLLKPGILLVPPGGPTTTSSSVAGTSGSGGVPGSGAAGSGGFPNAQSYSSSGALPSPSPAASASANSASSSSARSPPAGSAARGSTLDRLENFFTGKPGGNVWSSGTSAAPSRVTNLVSSQAPSARPSVVTPSNAAPAAPVLSEPPEPIMDKMVRASSRSLHWLFLLLLLIVTAIGVQRYWRKRANRQEHETA